MASTPIAQLDFDQIKNNIKTYLQGQTQFADYDYDGSTLSVLLDVLAYNTFYNNFYSNMALGEMFLDSAQLRSSIVSHCKELNYLPRSYRSSRATVTLTFSPGDSPSFITIPKGTKFTTQVDGTTYTFSTDIAYTVKPVDGVYSLTNVQIFEGTLETELYSVTATSKYTISNDQVDTDSVDVRVFASSASGAAVDEYVFKPNLFDVTAAQKVYYLQPAEKQSYEVTFGNNAFGREPIIGEVVEISYRVSSGTNPNGATTFTPTGTISGYTATVTTTVNSEAGAERESLESIKFYAPKSIQIQERAVTESDYENLLKNEFAEIQAVSVYGGEELTPPRYGRVIVAVDVSGADGVSENNKVKYANFLNDRCPLSIEPVIVSPDFLYVRVISTVFYNTKLSAKSDGQIETIVRNAISGYNTSSLADFSKNARQSRLARAIDDSDSAIVSNDTELQMIIDLNPLPNVATTYSFSYKNALVVDHPLELGEDITAHKSAVKSSNFVYNNTTAFIQDEGNGILQILTNAADGFLILDTNIGTVNYETGAITINNLTVPSFTGSAIKLYGRPRIQDIIGPKDRIISIRDADVGVEVEAAEI